MGNEEVDGTDPYESLPDESQENPVDGVSRRELTRLILERLQKLPETQRKVLALYYFEDLRLREIAEAFNLTNTPSFSTPNATFATPTFNADGSVRSYGNYSVISGTVSSARQLQVGAYVRF